MTDAVGNDGGKKTEIPFDYDTNDKKSSDRIPFFNGNPTSYPFWKTRMYSYIIGVDVDFLDLVEEGVVFDNMDKEGVVSHLHRKSFTPSQSTRSITM